VHASWPEPVERVAGFLREAGVEARLEEFGSGTPTARDAARAAGCTLEQIVKTLVLLCDGRPLVTLVPGDRRADLDKIATAAGAAKARIASAAEVETITGFAPGAVAPFPLPGVGRVFIDRTLLAHDTVWIGAGSPAHIAAVRPTDLMRLARAEPIDAVLEPAYDAAAKGDTTHA
jgi:Cys-tRNA(Pro)/Cys-tRNA(Cys) deacylase